MEKISEILQRAKAAIEKADTLDALEAIRLQYLGKKGELTEVLKQLGTLPPEERPVLGEKVNIAKADIQTQLETRRTLFQQQAIEARLQKEKLDITLPGRGGRLGSLHPVTRVKERVEKFFSQMGFSIVEGPEIENDYYNFEALNFPAHHPSRAEHDTFYFSDGNLLRTHTSPVQIREMEKKGVPIRVLAMGRVYRCDYDLRHTPMFHQVEALLIDKNITFANLKSILNEFLNYFFEQSLKTRFRPSYFPFTEPSAEVDVECVQCHGKGCRLCSYSGWLEILGSGMVHPNVLRKMNIDPEQYSGFAFGIGLDRLAMLRYEIDDLRMLFENDYRFLEQF